MDAYLTKLPPQGEYEKVKADLSQKTESLIKIEAQMEMMQRKLEDKSRSEIQLRTELTSKNSLVNVC